MTVEELDPRYDAAKDEMRYPYPFTGVANCEVRVCGATRTLEEAWVKNRIEGWFGSHDKPKPGTSVKIPDYQFEPKLHQPDGFPRGR